jgi:hypothetical protein
MELQLKSNYFQGKDEVSYPPSLHLPYKQEEEELRIRGTQCKGAFPWGARVGVGLEGGQRLQLVPPFPWPSDELEVNLTHGALSDLELKLSIKCNDFRCMVPNNFCSISWETTQYGHMAQAWRTPARIPLCPACCSRKQGRQAGGASWKGELEGRHAMPCP